MKKLFRHEWKYYLFFGIAITIFLIMDLGYGEGWSLGWEWLDSSDVLAEEINTVTGWLAFGINGRMLGYVIRDVLVGILLLKAGIFWIEKDSWGREFFGTLPVTRTERMLFHLVMNALLIVFPVIIYTGYLYIEVSRDLEANRVGLPWLGASILGEMMVAIGYLLFLLGLVSVLECLFVDGFIRIIGTAGSMFMLWIIGVSLLAISPGSKLIQAAYGFFSMKTAGGLRYGSIVYTSWKRWQWVHDPVSYDIYFQDKAVRGNGGAAIVAEEDELGRLLDFTRPSSYIFHLAGYLVLAALLAAIAVMLAKRQELSKSHFYFTFGRVIFAALISGTIGALMGINVNLEAWGHKFFIIAAIILIFCSLIYLMNPDRAGIKKK
ncbi:MAG: hypothetical protein NC300_11940 [Bacteroidales bacterium]|nr:hypothetical protein [Clostridium sp.]MCM1204843.1 hypothetical protein [Bacteroidales bacterium]